MDKSLIGVVSGDCTSVRLDFILHKKTASRLVNGPQRPEKKKMRKNKIQREKTVHLIHRKRSI